MLTRGCIDTSVGAILAAAGLWLPAPTCAQAGEAVPQAGATTTAADGTRAFPDEPASNAQLADIVVTAQKRSESINKVGISITAATADQLTQAGVSSTADLIKVVPGFNFTPSAYAAPVYTLRGIGFYETSLGAAPTVSVYVDETPLAISSMTVGAGLDLERVEVLKGPQGTLFGNNSTGGAINYIAAKPTYTTKAGADVTYGRFNAAELKGFVSGPLGSTLRARLAARYERSDDWQRSHTRNDTIGGTDVLAGRLLIDWEPSADARFTLNVNGWRDRSDNPAAQLVSVVGAAAPVIDRASPLPPPGDNRAADWDSDLAFKRDNRFWQASLRGEFDMTDTATLTSITAYGDLRRDSVVDADGSAVRNFAVRTPGTAKSFSQELRVAGELGRARYVVGGNFAYDDIRDQGNPIATESGFPFNSAISTSNQRVDTWAAFANLDLPLTGRLTAQGGVRYTDQHRRFDGCTFDEGTGLAQVLSRVATLRSGQTVVIPTGGCGTLGADFLPAIVRDRLNEDNLSWRANLNWQVTPLALLYANVSRGYKSGAFPTAGALYSLQLRPAVQESVLAYEAGFKLTLADRTLQVNGAAFYYDYSDKQLRGRIIDLVIGPQNALINVPRSRIAGGEIQVTWQPVRGLVLNGGSTYVSSRILGNFTNFNALAQQQNFNGQSFPLTPKWSVIADGEYTTDLSRGMQAFAGGSMNHQSSTNGGLGELPLFAMPGYTLFDLRAGIKATDGRWRATAFVRNLTDKFYSTLVLQPGPDNVIRYVGQPRTYGLTVSFRY